MSHRRFLPAALSVVCLCLLGPAAGMRATASSDVATASQWLPKSVTKNLVWLSYVFPGSSWLWDEIHDGHTTNDGGIWSYPENVESELERFVEQRHPTYDSAWDLSSNIGYFLRRLSEKHPDRRFFGSDISKVMVNSTRSQCASCLVEAFDVSQLQYSKALPKGFPDSVDIIIVADVMNYISWGGWPPLWNSDYPDWLVKHHEATFLQHLTQLARKEVIFTNSQGNQGVARFFKDMGIEQMGTFGVAQGTALSQAGVAASEHGSGRSHMWWILGATCMLMAAATAMVLRSQRVIDGSKRDMSGMPKTLA